MAEEYWTDERVAEFAKQVAEQVAQQVAERVAQEIKKADDPYLTAEEIAVLLHLGRDDDDLTTPLEIRQRDAVAYQIRENDFPGHDVIVAGQRFWYRSKVLAWVDARGRKQKRKRRKDGPKELADGGAAAMRVRRKLQKEEGLLED